MFFKIKMELEMKKILCVFLLVLSVSVAYSQTTDNKVVYNVYGEEEYVWKKNRLGASASMMYGYGLTYQRFLNDDLALKTQFFLYGTTDNEDYGDEMDFAFGVDLQYNLIKTNRSRFFASIGGYYNYVENAFEYYSYNEEDNIDIERAINLGFGFGAEIRLLENITAYGEVGYSARLENNHNWEYNGSNDHKYTASKPKRFSLGVGAGVMFAF